MRGLVLVTVSVLCNKLSQLSGLSLLTHLRTSAAWYGSVDFCSF